MSGWNNTPAGSSAVDDDVFAMDGTSQSPDDLQGQQYINKEGLYHFEISDVIEELATVNPKTGKSQSPYVDFLLTCLASNAGMEGKHYKHRIYLGNVPKEGGAMTPLEPWAVKRAMTFGYGIGVIKRGLNAQNEPICLDAQTGTPKIGLATWRRAKGRQLKCKLEYGLDKDKKKKDRVEIPFSQVYHPLDEMVADWPVMKEALAAIVGIQPWLGNNQNVEPHDAPDTSKKSDTASNKAPAGVDLSDL